MRGDTRGGWRPMPDGSVKMGPSKILEKEKETIKEPDEKESDSTPEAKEGPTKEPAAKTDVRKGNGATSTN